MGNKAQNSPAGSSAQADEPDEEELKQLEKENEKEGIGVEEDPDMPLPDNERSVDSLSTYLREIGATPLLSQEEEIRLGRLARNGDNDAKQKLLQANLRLVVSIARRYLGNGMELEDMIQEGSLGLMKAVERFNPEKGFKLSTYATWWIRQAVTRGIADTGKTIRIPVHMHESMLKIRQAQRQLAQKNGREPTPVEVADYLEENMPNQRAKVRYWTVKKVEEIMKTMATPVSLNAPVGEDDENILADFLPANEDQTPEREADLAALKASLDSAMSSLTEREKKVICMRFGFCGYSPMTLEEVGKVFNLTRERIRQLEGKAIRKMRRPQNISKLRDFI